MNRAWKRTCYTVSSAIIASFAINVFSVTAQDKPDIVPVYAYKVVNAFPHDREAFTQGLFFENGYLYEGTGLYGQSALPKMELKTGEVLKSYRLQASYFGEGTTHWQKTIIQLTWRENKGFVYKEDKECFRLVLEFSYPTEGWGLTHEGKRLIMSDGSAFLYFLDPQTFKQTGQIEVRNSGVPLTNLNELEYVKG